MTSGLLRCCTGPALNAYIGEAANVDGVTARTFRMWKGTLAAFEIGQERDATINAMADAASEVLSNTQTIAPIRYIHPAVIDLAGGDPVAPGGYKREDLYVAEGRLLKFLKQL